MKKSGRCTLPVLPDELITEILSWVPVKQLLQFRCVCKFWKTLISDPQFIKLHLKRSPNNTNLIVSLILTRNNRFVMSCSKSSFIQDTHITSAEQVLVYHGDIIGSCNGLVCCLYSPSPHYFCVSFWNPERRAASRYSTYLHVDSTHFSTFAYGYDKSSDSYMVVALLLYPSLISGKLPEVKVYTMGQHCWRDFPTFPAFPTCFRNNGIFISGTLNWLAIARLNGVYNHKRQLQELFIVSLDLAKETYKQFLLPAGFRDGISQGTPYTALLGDYLCLCVDYEITHLLVWQMKEFGVEKSWTRFLKVSYRHLGIGAPFLFHLLEPLCVSENGDVLVFVHRTFQIILYNWRDDTVKVGNYGNNEHRINAKGHVQSLILPY